MAADETIRLEIVTPYELIYDGHVHMVVITAADGELGILPGHTAMFAALKDGEIRFRINDDWQILSSSIGYAEISPDLTIIVVNSADGWTRLTSPGLRNRLNEPESGWPILRPASSNAVDQTTL